MSNWETLLGGSDIGKNLDKHFHEWKTKGMNGTPEERELLLKQAFHGARFNGRIVMAGAPAMGLTQPEVMATLKTKCVEAARQEAKRAGFDAEQTELWVDAHVKAYDSLAEEFVSA